MDGTYGWAMWGGWAVVGAVGGGDGVCVTETGMLDTSGMAISVETSADSPVDSPAADCAWLLVVARLGRPSTSAAFAAVAALMLITCRYQDHCRVQYSAS